MKTVQPISGANLRLSLGPIPGRLVWGNMVPAHEPMHADLLSWNVTEILSFFNKTKGTLVHERG